MSRCPGKHAAAVKTLRDKEKYQDEEYGRMTITSDVLKSCRNWRRRRDLLHGGEADVKSVFMTE